MRVRKAAGIACLAIAVSAHVGSPDVFFTGRAGLYDIRATIRQVNGEVNEGIAIISTRQRLPAGGGDGAAGRGHESIAGDDEGGGSQGSGSVAPNSFGATSSAWRCAIARTP